MTYTGVKVFSATRPSDREALGEAFTLWTDAHGELKVVDVRVLQSSDRAYHCLTFVVFYREA